MTRQWHETLIFSTTLLIVTLFISSTDAAYAKASFEPIELRCEYLETPLNVDIQQPLLSWKLKANNMKDRGLLQTAVRVLVASDPSLLKKNEGDLWDDGEMTVTEGRILYAGKPLHSITNYYWKIQVRDQDNQWSSWSKPAMWRTGYFDQSEWQAKWIGSDQEFHRIQGEMPTNDAPDPWLRKTFSLDAKPKQAYLSIASVGYHELYVNGKKISDAVLSPNVATHKVRARYVTYDISDALKKGDNAIGLWMGMSWSVFSQYKTDDKPQTPIALAQAEIDLNDSERMTLVSDESWRTHPSPNTMLGVWDFMNFGGELYDANKEISDWCNAHYNDGAWKQATVYHPELIISAELLEPNRKIKEIKPVAIETLDDGSYRIDMGVNYAGFFEMDVKGEPGQRIDFEFSEREEDLMTHRLHSAYIIGPKGKDKFENRFNYGSGRWVHVKGLTYKPKLSDAKGYLVRTDYRRVGHFESDSELLNHIYDTVLWTYENITIGGYVVDCPQRERMGYGGDGHATIDCGLTNYDLAAFYRKWGQDWRDVQKPSGDLPYTAPTYWGGGGPAWSGFCITLPWDNYRRYGDKRILEENYPTMQRWLAFLETQQKNNLMVRWGGQWDFLGDWLWPGAEGVNGDARETLFFNNAYWVYNLRTAAMIAEVLGDVRSAKAYFERSKEVSNAIQKEFYNPEDASYVNGFQAYLAIALKTHIMPGPLREKVWDRLEKEIFDVRKGHIHAGITGGAFLFKTLNQFEKNDWIYEMASKEDYPSWGDELKRGATTIWEDWEGRKGHSLLHSSLLFIGSWFIEGLGGIQNSAPGFQNFTIRPAVLPDRPISEVKTSYDSEYGLIRSEWKKQDGKLTLEVEVPPNTSAMVILPTSDSNSITEGGKSIKNSKDVLFVEQNDDAVVLKVGSGNYSFTLNL